MESSELVYLSSQVGQCLNCKVVPLAELAAWCVTKAIYLSGKYTKYEIITDYKLSHERLLSGMPSLTAHIQSLSGLLLINEKGVTTEAAKPLEREFFTQRYYFSMDEVEGQEINALGKKKIKVMWPSIFYFINKIL